MRILSISAATLGLILTGLSPLAAQTMVEMRQEASAELEKADAKLNRVYQKLLKENADHAPFCSDLREAQRAWLKYVDFHLKSLFPLREGEDPTFVYGTIYPLELTEAKTAMITKRTAELESLGSSEER
jgi:uncharacterized protein YecT (DUF1311 family)